MVGLKLLKLEDSQYFESLVLPLDQNTPVDLILGCFWYLIDWMKLFLARWV
jgi:hypothetical protein